MDIDMYNIENEQIKNRPRQISANSDRYILIIQFWWVYTVQVFIKIVCKNVFVFVLKLKLNPSFRRNAASYEHQDVRKQIY